jgi:hypothetical protein
LKYITGFKIKYAFLLRNYNLISLTDREYSSPFGLLKFEPVAPYWSDGTALLNWLASGTPYCPDGAGPPRRLEVSGIPCWLEGIPPNRLEASEAIF